MKNLWTRVLDGGPRWEGPTHSLGLLRILLALLAWATWASDLTWFQRPGPFHAALGILFFAASSLMVVGCWSRVATAATALAALACCYVYGYAERNADFSHHHQYLLACAIALLALSPCGRSLSFDRWRAQRRADRGGPPPPPQEGPLWALRLIALQVAAVYFWGGVDKLDPNFLNGVRLQHTFFYFYFAGAFPDWPWFAPACAVAAWIVVVFEFAMAFGLFVPRLQPGLMAAGALFHGLLYWLTRVGPFSVIVLALYLSFVPPAQVRRALQRLVGCDRDGVRT